MFTCHVAASTHTTCGGCKSLYVVESQSTNHSGDDLAVFFTRPSLLGQILTQLTPTMDIRKSTLIGHKRYGIWYRH